MHKIILIILITMLLTGCATYDNMEQYVNTEVLNNTYDTNWHVYADYVNSHYLESTRNEKALILANSIKDTNDRCTIERRYYRTEIIYIIHDGIRIWPCFRDEDLIKEYDKFELLEVTREIIRGNNKGS